MLPRVPASSSAVLSRRAVREDDLVPTEYERRSCAGMGPRIRARQIAQARLNPKVALGDKLSEAVYANDAEKVRALLAEGADPNHLHPTVCCDVPLARTKCPEVAKLLLAHPEIDVNMKDLNDYSILTNMVLHQPENVELVAQMLAHPKLDLDIQATEVMRTAARFAKGEMLKLLLEHPKIDINGPGGVLHCVVRRTDVDSVKLVEWLLQQETLDINLFAENGTTALMNVGGWDSLTIEIGEREAVKRPQIAKRQVEILKLLLARRDLDVNAVDSKKDTALHWMSRAGRLDLLEVLLKDPRCLPSIWHQNTNGESPLDAALSAAEKEKSRKKWETPPHLAKFDEVIALLKSVAEEKKAELEKLVPAELSKHPGTWSMAVKSL